MLPVIISILSVLALISAKPNCGRRRIEIAPQRQTILNGESAQFLCSSDDDALQYIWYKDKKSLKVDGHNDSAPYLALPENQLFIPKAIKGSENDFEGSYYCAVKDKCGESRSTPALLKIASSKEDILAIKYKYHIEESSAPRVGNVQEEELVAIGDTLRLDCPARGVQVRISWEKDGKTLETNKHIQVYRSGELRVFNASKEDSADDSGEYRCAAENKFGVSRSKPIFVIVKAPDQEPVSADEVIKADVGSVVIMECPPRVKAIPETWWLKDGKNVSDTTDGHVTIGPAWKLAINKVTYADAGVYICESTEPIKYNLGNKKKSIRLRVHRKAYFTSVPKDITVWAGDNATFECRFSGDPLPSFAWYRHDAEMPVDRASISPQHDKFTIANVQQSDEGEYACSIRNHMGGVSSSAKLHVIVPIKTVLSHKEIAVKTNETISVQCAVQGHPATLNFWSPQDDSHLYFPGQTSSDGRLSVSSDMRLTIENIEMSDAGIYLCSALNAIEGASARFLLVVSDNGESKGDHAKQKKRVGKTYGPIMRIENAETVNSTAIKISWKLLMTEPSIDSYYVYWRATADAGFGNFVNQTDLTNASCVINFLHPHTSYEFFIVPYYGISQGTPSNSWTGTTNQAVPSAPPSKVTIRYHNSSSVQLAWEPPPEDAWNGELTGFQYKIVDGQHTILKEEEVRSGTRMATINDIAPGKPFYFSVAAKTKAGLGPYADAGELVLGRYLTVDSCPPSDVVHAESGSISSPGYPLYFHTNEDLECSYFLATNSDRNIQLIFDEVQLGGGHIAVYEGLNKRTREPLGLLTGRSRNGNQTFTTNDSNGMTVVFFARTSGIWKSHWFTV